MGEPRKFTKHTMPRHVRALRQQCGHMAHAYNVGGMPPARDREGGFRTLLRIIVDQQISVHAGAAIWAKLEKRLTDITAARVLAVQEHTLQGMWPVGTENPLCPGTSKGNPLGLDVWTSSAV